MLSEEDFGVSMVCTSALRSFLLQSYQCSLIYKKATTDRCIPTQKNSQDKDTYSPQIADFTKLLTTKARW